LLAKGIRLDGWRVAAPAPVGVLLELLLPLFEGLDLQRDISAVGETFLVLPPVSNYFVVVRVVDSIFMSFRTALSFEDRGDDLSVGEDTSSMTFSLRKGSSSWVAEVRTA
jgi:hypothetical protein